MIPDPWVWSLFRQAGRRAAMGSVGLALALHGCAPFSPDGGMAAVNQIAAPQLGTIAVKTEDQTAEAGARAQTVPPTPLSARDAVRIAILNNKGLQAAFNELGIAEAVMAEQMLPPNPTFSLSRISTPFELDIERRIVTDIIALATLPAREEIAGTRFRQAELRTAEETLRLGTAVRRSYYRGVAALALADALAKAVEAADTAAKLAQQLARTGAMNKLDLAREQVFHAELAAQLDTARQRADGEREHLVRLLGLDGAATRFKLPHALPPVPERPRHAASVEAEAIRHRLDLQIARLEAAAMAKSYGLTEATRFINLLDVAGIVRTQHDPSSLGGTGGGVEADFQIPIFDFGEVRLRQAREAYMRAVNQLTERAINVRSEAREAYRAYRTAFSVAKRYRISILPLHETIAEETSLRYGAMQIDVFGLLTQARQRIAANIDAIEAQRNFWLAEVDLAAAIAGGGTGNDSAPTGLSVRSSQRADQ